MSNSLSTLGIAAHPIAKALVEKASTIATEDSIPLNISVREQICLLEERMKNAPEEMKIVIPEAIHHYADGIVCRETFMPKDVFLTGKLYKKEHIFTVMRGKVTHISEFGVETLTAPYIGVYPKGIKRVAIIEEDCLVAAYFSSEATTEEDFMNEVTAVSYTELGAYDPVSEELMQSLGGVKWLE